MTYKGWIIEITASGFEIWCGERRYKFNTINEAYEFIDGKES